MVCHRIAGSFHWELKMNRMAYGDRKIDTQPSNLGFTDTGATVSHFPVQVYRDLMEAMCEGKGCVIFNNVYYILDCDPREG
jgi:hypothetical protein